MESDDTEKKKGNIPQWSWPSRNSPGMGMKQRLKLSGLNYVLSLQSHLKSIKPTSLQSLNKTRILTNVQKFNN